MVLIYSQLGTYLFKSDTKVSHIHLLDGINDRFCLLGVMNMSTRLLKSFLDLDGNNFLWTFKLFSCLMKDVRTVTYRADCDALHKLILRISEA